MAEIHPTADLQGDVELAADVVIGPHCVLIGPLRLGPGCRLTGHVYLHGPLIMGSENLVYPFTCLGFAPQHARFDPATPGRGLLIGDGNTFREHVTVHRAFTDERPTLIGDRNLFMVGSHVGHDCHVGNECTLVNSVALGGHVVMADRAIVGGGTVVHQFVRIGRGAMLSGGLGATMDVPPFFMLTGINVCGSLNLVGMRRAGMPRADIDEVRWVYRTLYREGLALRSAIDVLRTRADRPLIREYVEFLDSSTRGICSAHSKAIRSAVVTAPAET
jgi:UDP-N-acetylglucosamine acyltransferase